MPLQQTSGNVTADAYGGGVAAVPNYIEDVFSTYLYTGTNSTSQSVPNGIDLVGKGGLVWEKARNQAASPHYFSTSGVTGTLSSNDTSAASGGGVTFGSAGYTLNATYGAWNTTYNITSWTFRKQPKFFDVVTYTGDGVDGKAISHSLGSVPGCIIVKNVTSGSTNWVVWHRSSAFENLKLNTTAAASGGGFHVYSASSTTFDVYNSSGGAASADFCNASGQSYVALLFAHNAGGFGLTGTDNVISCGSYTGTGATGNNVTLGYEPQWLLIKAAERAQDWFMFDTMRGMTTTGGTEEYLLANSSGASGSGAFGINPTATGFGVNTAGTSFNASGEKYIYIAIRRGPMKVPTDATKVFKPVAQTTAAPTTVTTNFPVDMEWWRNSRTTAGRTNYSFDRLRGGTQQLRLNTTDAEQTDTAPYINYFDSNVAFKENFSNAGQDAIFWSFRRAPSFFDEVCYTGTGATDNTIYHNLGVVPELMIFKIRNNYTVGLDASGNWAVYHAALGNQARLALNLTNAVTTGTGVWYSTTPTSTYIKTSADDLVNKAGSGYVAYLFATCPGVSKVGSYTGNGSTQTINCGFTGGARFVLIKRTDSTGDWYVYDTARGMTTLTDPYLLLNSTAAESATLGSVTTVSTGFALNASILAAINTNGASYIFLAIA